MTERTDKQIQDALDLTQTANIAPDSSHRLEDALIYHVEDFNVIPIPKPGQQVSEVSNNDDEASPEYADGKSAKGYGPWGELQSHPQTLEDVERRFKHKEDCNIAILTGTLLGIIAFDIDGKEAQNHFDKLIEGLGDPKIADAIRDTMQTRTGGSYGRHIICRVNPLEFMGIDSDCNSKMFEAALFSRFNQKAQVIPSREYPSDIFDQHLDLMQIKNVATDTIIVRFGYIPYCKNILIFCLETELVDIYPVLS